MEALKPDFRFGDKQRVVGNDGRSILDAEGTAEDRKFDLGSEY
jgi:hypothetical protein